MAARLGLALGARPILAIGQGRGTIYAYNYSYEYIKFTYEANFYNYYYTKLVHCL